MPDRSSFRPQYAHPTILRAAVQLNTNTRTCVHKLANHVQCCMAHYESMMHMTMARQSGGREQLSSWDAKGTTHVC